jgi:hypothetical protein
MGFLDKLKPQPRWKHADPAVRLEAIRELDDAAELALIAESDPDVRVRRLVLTRLTDPEVIHRLAAADPDADLRERAADSLVALACRTNGHRHAAAAADLSGTADADPALRAVRALTDSRRLSAVARSEAADDVRAEALARITEERALGAIARHAKHEATARAALARLTAADELLEVALNGDHKDVALEAFERRTGPGADLDLLRSIEARASQKAVVRRARAAIQDIENAEAARLAALEERRRQVQGVLDAIEQVGDLAADVAMARSELTRLTDAWQALDVTEEAARDRFAALTMAAEAAIVGRQREADDMAERRRLRAEAVATRETLCARVETLDGDDVLAQLVPIEEEWRSLLPLVGNGPEADRLAERFARAVAACRTRHEMGARLADERTRLEALVAEAEGLAPAEDATLTRWPVLSREARGVAAVLTEAGRPAADLVERIDAVDARFAADAAARGAAAEQARQEKVLLLQRLVARARRAAEADTITLREGERLMRDLRSGLESAGSGYPREIDALVTELRTLQEQIAPRVRELREMDEWRRFANGQRQEQLIAMAEAIVGSLKADDEAGKPSDLAATAKALRELHAEWQEVADAPRAVAQRHWDRFRTATDFIRARCEVYFAKVREERSATLTRKAAIVAEAEALAASSDWAKAPVRFQELQTEWQTLGPVSRETGRELAQRFRTACNTFFARRREDLADRKRVWAENLAKKEALCARVEALATSTDWDAASAEVKRTQAEWKTIGPVRKNKSEAIWNRFRAAADAFFERYHHRHEINVATKLAEREALVVDLEQLVSEASAGPPADLAERVQQLRQTWNRSVPIPAAGMKVLADRWQAALAGLVAAHPAAFAGTDLDPAAVVHRMEKLVARIENHLTELPAEPERGASQTELLAARLRSALATNAMGGRSSAEARWRAAADAVKDAQAAWQKLPTVRTPEADALAARFREACRRIQDRARRPAAGGPRRHDEPAAMAR